MLAVVQQEMDKRTWRSAEEIRLQTLQTRIGYVFISKSLLEQALTHKSMGSNNYERLEFLGDAILGKIVTARLVGTLTDIDEGALSRIRASLVSSQALGRRGKQMKIQDSIRIAPSVATPGERVIADVVEALIGAAFQDGGDPAAETLVDAFLGDALEHVIDNPGQAAAINSKMRLQIALQKRGKPQAEYEIISDEDHRTYHVFTVRCAVSDMRSVDGKGKTVKDAQSDAARRFLALYGW